MRLWACGQGWRRVSVKESRIMGLVALVAAGPLLPAGFLILPGQQLRDKENRL